MKVQATCEYMEKVESDMVVVEAWKASKQLQVRLNVAVFGRNLAEKLMHSLVTELVDAADSVV